MNKNVGTLFGYTPVQLCAILAVCVAVMWFVGSFAGLITGIAVIGISQYRIHRKNRPETAWEISEKGTRELWNDGPKAPVHRSINSK